jgi:hypothetical protein
LCVVRWWPCGCRLVACCALYSQWSVVALCVVQWSVVSFVGSGCVAHWSVVASVSYWVVSLDPLCPRAKCSDQWSRRASSCAMVKRLVAHESLYSGRCNCRKSASVARCVLRCGTPWLPRSEPSKRTHDLQSSGGAVNKQCECKLI